MRLVVALCWLAGCALGVDGGMLQQPEFAPKGAAFAGHAGLGGGGMSWNQYLLAFDVDTRIDVASGASRWNAGASVLGGVRLGPAFGLARAGIWRAIVSASKEAAVVPSFELGAYVPLEEHNNPSRKMEGQSSTGIVVGVREDLDDARYFTIFVGYALFIIPGY